PCRPPAFSRRLPRPADHGRHRAEPPAALAWDANLPERTCGRLGPSVRASGLCVGSLEQLGPPPAVSTRRAGHVSGNRLFLLPPTSGTTGNCSLPQIAS